MFRKVLISDDLGSINKGVTTALTSLNILAVDQVQYCDDAYLKIKAGYKDQTPYDLFITDLSFEIDYRSQEFPSGDALVERLKKEHPTLKIIVFSIEDRLQKVRSLMLDHHLDAYVCKGRRGLSDLKKAIKKVYNNTTFTSAQISKALDENTSLEINDYDIQLLKLLSKGLSQDEISTCLRDKNIIPSSLSSIEKHLNRMRIQFKANNAIHLVAITKDLGLI